MRKILVEKDICVRGLAHPVVSGIGTERFMEKIKQQEEADRQQVHYILSSDNQVILCPPRDVTSFSATLIEPVIRGI